MTADRAHVRECLAFARMALHWRDGEDADERAARLDAAAAAAEARRLGRQRLIESRDLIEVPAT